MGLLISLNCHIKKKGFDKAYDSSREGLPFAVSFASYLGRETVDPGALLELEQGRGWARYVYSLSGNPGKI